MSESTPSLLREMPPGGARLYAWLFLVVSILGLLTGGLDKLALLPDSATKVCRAFHLCGPRDLKQLPAFSTDQPGGSTWDSVERDQVPPMRAALEADNPDWDLRFVRGEEERLCSGPFNTHCFYRYHGTWAATPKWRNLFDYWPTWVVLAILLAGSIALILRRRR